MTQAGAEGGGRARRRGKEIKSENVPEHDKDVRHMVHLAFMDVLQFFVGRGHKQ